MVESGKRWKYRLCHDLDEKIDDQSVSGFRACELFPVT